jgi:hypothetical protein
MKGPDPTYDGAGLSHKHSQQIQLDVFSTPLLKGPSLWLQALCQKLSVTFSTVKKIKCFYKKYKYQRWSKVY